MSLAESLSNALKTGIYNYKILHKNIGISRYWLNKVEAGEEVPDYIYLALNDYLFNGVKNGNK